MRHLEKRWKDTQTRQVRLRQSNFKNEFEDVWNILKYRWQCCKAVGLLCSTCLHLLSFWSLAHNWQRLVTTCKINSQDWGRKRCSPYRLPTKSLQLGSRSAVGEKGTSDPCETAPPLKWNPAMVLPILWKQRICLCNRNTATDWTRRSWNDLMHLITSGSQQAWFVCRQHPTASNSIRQHPTGATAIDSHHQQSPAIARLQTFIHPMLKLSALTVTIRNLLQQVLPVASAQKIRVCFSDSISALLHSEFQNGILLEKLWVLWVLTDESLIIWIQMVSVLSWRSDCNSTFS